MPVTAVASYAAWVDSESADRTAELQAMRLEAELCPQPVGCSLLMVVAEEEEAWIKTAVASAEAQAYPWVELCVAAPERRRSIVDRITGERRIPVNVAYLGESPGWPAAFRAALELATHEMAAVLGPADALEPDALFRLLEGAAPERSEIRFSDEDMLGKVGDRREPNLKSHVSRASLLPSQALGGLAAMPIDLMARAAGAGWDGTEHDLLLRAASESTALRRVPGILYHRRDAPPPRGTARPLASEGAIQAAARRMGQRAVVSPDPRDERRMRVVLRSRRERSVTVVATGAHPTLLASVVPEGVQIVSSADLVETEITTELVLFMAAGAQPPPSGPAGWFRELVATAKIPGIGAVGPVLIERGLGRRQAPGYLCLPEPLGPGSFDPPVGVGREPARAPALLSECMMVPLEALRQAGGLGCFAPGSLCFELDLSFRLRRLGHELVVIPTAVVSAPFRRKAPTAGDLADVLSRWWVEMGEVARHSVSPFQDLQLHPAATAAAIAELEPGTSSPEPTA